MDLGVEKQTLFELLSPGNRGYHIPSFQRPLTWDETHISRLFEDIEDAFLKADSSDLGLKFMGSMILLEDKENEEILPANREQLPDDVQTIVDGQQRLSIFSVLFVVLHNELSKCEKNISSFEDADEVLVKHYKSLIKLMMSELEGLFRIDRADGDGTCRYYPKLIRTDEDICSRVLAEKKYDSPIANFLWKYIEHIKGQVSNPEFVFQNRNQSQTYMDKIYTTIKAQVNALLGKAASSRIFELAETAGVRLEKKIKDIKDDGALNEETKSSMIAGVSVVVLSKIVTSRLLFIVARISDLLDGFDIFDALNTTGEPLTAIETYRAAIIKRRGGIEKFRVSKHSKHFKRIQQYLDETKSAEEKQAITANMVIQFAMSEDGQRLSKKLRNQRKFLNSRTDREMMSEDSTPTTHTEDGYSVTDLTRRFSYLSDFLRHVWDDPHSFNVENVMLSEDEEVAMLFLRDLNHTTVIPPLFRFYTRICRANDDQESTSELAQRLKEAVLATAAFSTIWRSAYGTTTNIDDVYRGVMQEHLAVDKKNSLAYQVNDYRNHLLLKLRERKLDDFDRWIALSKSIPIYRNASGVAKFLLFLASDNAIVSDSVEECYLTWSGRGASPTLLPKKWLDKIDIEHVAPRANHDRQLRWQGDQYESIYAGEAHDTVVNYVGNLLIVPKLVNQILRGKTWDEKRRIYQILGSLTINEFDAGVQALQDALAKPLRSTQIDALRNSNYLMLCKAVGMHEGDWTKEEAIEPRTNVVLKLAWERMKPWLIDATE